MPIDLIAYELLIAAVAIERGVELFVSRRNARELIRRGGVEHGRGHYPPMVALHAAFLIGCAIEPVVAVRPYFAWLGLPMMALALSAQLIRWWAITTLGVHWNTRILVLPAAPRVSRGPYRFFAHPNYVAVVVEGIALPLIHSSWTTALLFTTLNAWLLTVRIRSENVALLQMSTP